MCMSMQWASAVLQIKCLSANSDITTSMRHEIHVQNLADWVSVRAALSKCHSLIYAVGLYAIQALTQLQKVKPGLRMWSKAWVDGSEDVGVLMSKC